MLHKNVISLMEEFGIEVSVSSRETYHRVKYTAYAGEKQLSWLIYTWSKRINELTYRNSRYAQPRNWVSPGVGRVGNGTKVKQFIQLAKAREWLVGYVSITIGPDAQHDLETTIRIHNHGGWKVTVTDPRAIRLIPAVIENDMPVEVFLDWLRDENFLKD